MDVFIQPDKGPKASIGSKTKVRKLWTQSQTFDWEI